MVEEGEVGKYIREKVGDWDDEIKTRARYKAFSGQRCDWEPQYHFWRDLILSISRHFHLLFLSPFLMKSSWFNRGGLTPLCLDDVLLEMYKAGDLLRMTDLGDPFSGQLFQFVKKMIHFSRAFRKLTFTDILDDRLVVPIILEGKATGVTKVLSDSNWTSSCIISMRKFVSLCEDQGEALAVLSYLSRSGKAKYFSSKRKEHIEGVKLSLSSAATTRITSVDSDMLQLVWTVEELQQQLDMIDKQYDRSRKMALAAMRAGDKSIALRNARHLKLASENREKVRSLLNRVEGVLLLLLDAESTKKVFEALQIGSQAIKENQVKVEQVDLCLQELNDLMNSQEEIKIALELRGEEGDEDVEAELQELESQIKDENILISTPDVADATRNAEQGSGISDMLSSAVADLTLEAEADGPSCNHSSGSATPAV